MKNREKYEEYKEPEVDWSKVPVDTPILVSRDGDGWYKNHFAKFENGEVYAWSFGCTSWTVPRENYITRWEYAELAEETIK